MTKEIFQDAWAISDSRAAFAHALEEHGLILAKGDRRGHVAVDHRGEAYAVSKYTGITARQVRARLGKPDDLPSKDAAHRLAATRVSRRLEELRLEDEHRAARELRRLEQERLRIEKENARERDALQRRQAAGRDAQQQQQMARFRRGWLGFLDRLTGRKRQIEEENRREASVEMLRFRQEREAQSKQQATMVQRHDERTRVIETRSRSLSNELNQDIKTVRDAMPDEATQKREDFTRKRREAGQRPKRQRSRGGPEPG